MAKPPSRKTLSYPPKHTQIGALNRGYNSLFNEPKHARFGGQEDPVRKTPPITSPPVGGVVPLLIVEEVVRVVGVVVVIPVLVLGIELVQA